MKTTKDQIKEFLIDLSGGHKIEINNLTKSIKLDDGYGKDKVYFCCGYDNKKGERCADGDFTHKKYIPVDIDIRLDYYNRTGKVLSTEGLEKEIETILGKIKGTDLGDYRYAVNSGNGLHLYYVGDDIEIDRDTYSHGVSQMQSMLNEIITPYECDPAVCNISRIMRMPGSINQRKKIHKDNVLWDLGGIECCIIQNTGKHSIIPGILPELALLYKKEQEELKSIREKTKEYKQAQSDWSDINDIDVGELACIARGVSIGNQRNDCIALKESHKNMGAYVYKPSNVVVNTGSSLIREKDKKIFTAYDIVYYEICNKSVKDTLQYFKDHYNVAPKKIEKKIEIKEIPHPDDKGFLYPSKIFDDTFECFKSEELVVIAAEPNSGKTTFAMDIITRNKDKLGRKGLYINLEFDIKNVWRQRWLSRNGYSKINLTDISPLPEDKKNMMDIYVEGELKKFDYINKPNGIGLGELVQILCSKAEEGYELVVIDTLGDIHGNSGDNSWSNQNLFMQTLQELAQKTGLAIIILHHKNKNGKFSGSMKIKDYSNVFIEVSTMEDTNGKIYTEYELSKDKFKGNMIVDCYYNNGLYEPF